MEHTGAAGGWGTSAELARSSRAEVDVAWLHRETLVAAAVALVASAGHDPDLGLCPDADCGLATRTDDPVLCAVAHRLARIPGAPPRAAATAPVDQALSAFLAALTGAADAIRHCRQTEHPGPGCWFTPVTGLDGCGEVLRLLHRCG